MDDSTTLVAFRVQTPPSVVSVALVGSWDNFTERYAMTRDAGTGQWRGCHRFKNIICDGDSDLNAERGRRLSRDGALKMGGQYWYYYQLDGDADFCDQSQPCTTSCPLLPGQPVNVLEVPFERRPSQVLSSPGDLITVGVRTSQVWTLDPDDKFAKPRPAPLPSLCSKSRTSLSRPKTPSSQPQSPEHASQQIKHFPSARSRPQSALPRQGSSLAAEGISFLRKVPSLKQILTSKRPRSKSSWTDLHSSQAALHRKIRHDHGRSLDMQISSPTLIHRSDLYRECFPLPTTSRSTDPSQCPELGSSLATAGQLSNGARKTASEPSPSISANNPSDSTPQLVSYVSHADPLRSHQATLNALPSPNHVDPDGLLTFRTGSGGYREYSSSDPDETDDEEDACDPQSDDDIFGNFSPTGLSPAPASPTRSSVAHDKIRYSAFYEDSTPRDSFIAASSQIRSGGREHTLGSRFSVWSDSSDGEEGGEGGTHSSMGRDCSIDLSHGSSLLSTSTNADAEIDDALDELSQLCRQSTLGQTDEQKQLGGQPSDTRRKAMLLSGFRGYGHASSGYGVCEYGYSLSHKEQYASDATLRKAQTPTIVSNQHLFNNDAAAEQVDDTYPQSWARHGNRNLLGMKELHEDLGYLGGMIA